MKPFYSRHLIALVAIFMAATTLQAQPFQRLYAYDPGTGLETGHFNDVEAVNFFGPGGANVFGVGSSFNFSTDGLFSIHDQAGTPIRFYEFLHPAGAEKIEGAAVTQMLASNNLAAAFNSSVFATDVASITPGGVVNWIVRCPRVQTHDIESYPIPGGGEMIWIVGESDNGQLMIHGLDNTGATVFANEYWLSSTAWNYSGTKGFEIEFDPGTFELTVVGTADVATFPVLNEVIVLRLDPGGNPIWGRAYGNPGAGIYTHGKALVASNSIASGYVVGFEYSDDGTTFDVAGAMEIDPGGGVSWLHHYPIIGGGLSDGSEYIVNGIQEASGKYLMSGYYEYTAGGAPQIKGYSIMLDNFGPALQFNEYDFGGYYPSTKNLFFGMDWNPTNNFHYMVGEFNTFGSATSGWPTGPDPRSFWMVAADDQGKSDCSKDDMIKTDVPPLIKEKLYGNRITIPWAVPSPLVVWTVDPRDANQCSFPKRFADDTEANPADGLTATYLAATEQIEVQVLGEMTGEGPLQLWDMQGKMLQEITARNGKMLLPANGLSKGIYLLRYDIPGIGAGTRKLMIQ